MIVNIDRDHLFLNPSEQAQLTPSRLTATGFVLHIHHKWSAAQRKRSEGLSQPKIRAIHYQQI